MTNRDCNKLEVDSIVYHGKKKLKVLKKPLPMELDLYCEVLESNVESLYVGYKGYFIKEAVNFKPE